VRDEIENALAALGLPTRLPAGVAAEHVVASLAVDKKNRQGQVMFALPDDVGSAAPFDGRFVTPLPRDAVVSALTGRQ
jgi:3-dehydroquinate synthase